MRVWSKSPQNVPNSHAHSFELKTKPEQTQEEVFCCFFFNLPKEIQIKNLLPEGNLNIITLAQMNYELSGRLGGSQQKSVP